MEVNELETLDTSEVFFQPRRYTNTVLSIGNQNCLMDESLSQSSLLSINSKFGFVACASPEGKKKKLNKKRSFNFSIKITSRKIQHTTFRIQPQR
jgi:hypothetical protein